MRSVSVAVLPVLFLAGCTSLPFTRGITGSPSAGLRINSATPSAAELVASLNDNARRVQTIQCSDVDLDCQQGAQPVGLRASLVCQKPRNFRMSGKIMGNTAVDIGSNENEFWFWISKAQPPYLYHCSYDDYARGARLPFPFQPDWVPEALGMAEYDAAKQYEVVAQHNGVDLIESGTSSQGQPVRKVTRLVRARSGQWQVSAHIIQDATSRAGDGTYREICSATIMDWQQDTVTGALLPRQVQLVWPAEKMKMKMKFNRLEVNPQLSQDRVAVLFTRPMLRDVPSYDIARGLDSPAPGLRPAGYPSH
jgi:hypothetical protein